MSPATEVEEVIVDQPIPIPQYPKPPKKLKPARKQVKAGDVVKTETVQTGKEYSELSHIYIHAEIITRIVLNRYLVQQMGWRRPGRQLFQVRKLRSHLSNFDKTDLHFLQQNKITKPM